MRSRRSSGAPSYGGRPGATTRPCEPPLARMVAAARGDENMIPSMLDAVRAEATLGEICDALRAEWGVYTEPARF